MDKEHIYAECDGIAPITPVDCEECEKYYWENLHEDFCLGKNCYCCKSELHDDDIGFPCNNNKCYQCNYEKNIKYKKVNWFDEKLDDYYGHENDGKIFGIYTHEGEDIVDVTWYKSENERDEAVNNK